MNRTYLAEYDHDLRVSAYRGNPFIEALPDIITKEEFFSEFRFEPEYNEDMRTAPREERAHMLLDLLDLFVPLPRSQRLEQRISMMIRSGYRGRNPSEPGFYTEIQRRTALLKRRIDTTGLNLAALERMDELLADQASPEGLASPPSRRGRAERPERRRSEDLGAALIGVSGVGKTTAVKEICRSYQQVIVHGEYKGVPLHMTQVTYLHLKVPHNGSLRSLCPE